jgi:hypothetical protein
MEQVQASSVSIRRLIAIPAVITLLITILRLVGELQHWPTPWVSPVAGGGGAIIWHLLASRHLRTLFRLEAGSGRGQPIEFRQSHRNMRGRVGTVRGRRRHCFQGLQ